MDSDNETSKHKSWLEYFGPLDCINVLLKILCDLHDWSKFELFIVLDPYFGVPFLSVRLGLQKNQTTCIGGPKPGLHWFILYAFACIHSKSKMAKALGIKLSFGLSKSTEESSPIIFLPKFY